MMVSVVIPCYNAEKYLGETVSSVLTQTRLPDEILFIDDGSIDNTKHMINSYKDFEIISDRKIKVSIYENDVNRGIGYTRQKGIDVADGDYIAFLSSDDVWHEDFLKKSLEIIELFEPMNIGTYTDYYRCDKYLIPYEIFRCPEYSIDSVIDWALRKNMFINFSSVVFPKVLPVMFESQLRRGEDLIFLLDTVINEFEWVRIEQPLLYYRVMSGKFDINRFLILWKYNKNRLINLGIDSNLIERKFRESYDKVMMSKHKKILKRLLK